MTLTETRHGRRWRRRSSSVTVTGRKDDDNYIVTLTGRPCTRCGQPFDWHDDEAPHAIPRDPDQDAESPNNPNGCIGYTCRARRCPDPLDPEPA